MKITLTITFFASSLLIPYLRHLIQHSLSLPLNVLHQSPFSLESETFSFCFVPEVRSFSFVSWAPLMTWNVYHRTFMNVFSRWILCYGMKSVVLWCRCCCLLSGVKGAVDLVILNLDENCSIIYSL